MGYSTKIIHALAPTIRLVDEGQSNIHIYGNGDNIKFTLLMTNCTEINLWVSDINLTIEACQNSSIDYLRCILSDVTMNCPCQKVDNSEGTVTTNCMDIPSKKKYARKFFIN